MCVGTTRTKASWRNSIWASRSCSLSLVRRTIVSRFLGLHFTETYLPYILIINTHTGSPHTGSPQQLSRSGQKTSSQHECSLISSRRAFLRRTMSVVISRASIVLPCAHVHATGAAVCPTQHRCSPERIVGVRRRVTRSRVNALADQDSHNDSSDAVEIRGDWRAFRCVLDRHHPPTTPGRVNSLLQTTDQATCFPSFPNRTRAERLS
jgi:hypothetical protein